MHSRKDKQGFALIGGVALVVASLIGFKVHSEGQPKPGADNCVGTPVANTVIVIDRSDGLSLQTANEIRARAMNYVSDSVHDNELVSVFDVDAGSESALVPLVSLCRPRRTGSRLTENVAALEKQFRTNYEAPLDTALRARPGVSRESPLAQAMTDISLSRYLNSGQNTLIVFSDMMENTGRFSLYHCRTPAEVVPSFRASRVGTKERPTFRNTAVRLNIIPRLDQDRTALQCRDKLWLWFFGDDAGPNAGLTIDYLPGGEVMGVPARSGTSE